MVFFMLCGMGVADENMYFLGVLVKIRVCDGCIVTCSCIWIRGCPSDDICGC